MQRSLVALRMVRHFSRAQRLMDKSTFGLSDWPFKVSSLIFSSLIIFLIENLIAHSWTFG